MLLGADLKKDAATLEAAYDDELGVTAAFNLNVLVRINRELDADFNVRRFRHVAFYNKAAGRHRNLHREHRFAERAHQ
ncbi:MAG: L-histidine N(alpha)-methyltransferase [Pyrinomonadaceae bacterium]